MGAADAGDRASSLSGAVSGVWTVRGWGRGSPLSASQSGLQLARCTGLTSHRPWGSEGSRRVSSCRPRGSSCDGAQMCRGACPPPGFAPAASGKGWDWAGALGQQALEGVSVTCAPWIGRQRAERGAVPADAQISNLFHDDNRLLIQQLFIVHIKDSSSLRNQSSFLGRMGLFLDVGVALL